MFHPKLIFRIVGLLLLIEAVFLLSSVGVALYYNETTLTSLLISVGVMLVSGGLFYYFCRGEERNISRKDGYVVVTLCWVVCIIFANST